MYQARVDSHQEFFKKLVLCWKLEWRINFGDFVPTEKNTVMIDNSPRKCYFNPPWNCIFPHPWNGIRDAHSNIMKDLKIFLSICQKHLTVREFVASLLEDGCGVKDCALNLISKTGCIAKSLKAYTRFFRLNRNFLKRISWSKAQMAFCSFFSHFVQSPLPLELLESIDICKFILLLMRNLCCQWKTFFLII